MVFLNGEENRTLLSKEERRNNLNEPRITEDPSQHATNPNFSEGMGDDKLTPLDRLLKIEPKILSRASASAPLSQPYETFPFWREDERGIPNHFSRASLFSPIARQSRRLLAEKLLESRKDVKIMYTGFQLDEADCDVWMQIIHLARHAPTDTTIAFKRAEFLRGIGRSKSQAAYNWLLSVLKRLTTATLSIETNKFSIGIRPSSSALHLINSFHVDLITGDCRVNLDRRVVILFTNKEYTRLDWQKRLKIEKNKNMAKFLQRLICTSSDQTQRYSLDRLRALTQYTGQTSKFRSTISLALSELKR